MTLERLSHCKVNLILNILGKRPDGYHELESVMHPVAICDRLTFTRTAQGIQLTCSDASLPTDSGNLVYRAAALFLEAAGIRDGVKIHLEKRLPLAAGLGGGSSNAACTLQALNDLFGAPFTPDRLHLLAAPLGSDINFFLQAGPALVTGRGERIQPLALFPALAGAVFILVHPGFGISTGWAYKELAKFPDALNGRPGRAAELVRVFQGSLSAVAPALYNSLEAPALRKYPLLVLFQEFFRERDAACLMSGSGSTTFAIVPSIKRAKELGVEFRKEFGAMNWVKAVPCTDDGVVVDL